MENPLVSVVLITYNASKSILSTLESVKNQTYQPIELIISDDCSQDDTVNLCSNWISNNSSRFYKCELISGNTNVGPTENTHRGIAASSGVWLKVFGDDILFPTAIEDSITYAIKNKASFVLSQMIPFDEITNEHKEMVPPKNYFFPITNKEQYRSHLRFKLLTPAPTWLYTRVLYDELTSTIKSFRLCDDKPFVFNALKRGHTLLYMPKPTVLYRVSTESLSNSRSKNGEFVKKFNHDLQTFNEEYVFPEMKKHKLYFSYYLT